ncbi:uncharacterized protein V6R79_001824 [Siganus canaliculatus]
MSFFFCLCFLLQVTPSEFSDVVGDEPVNATAGDDVILPCYLEPPFNVSGLMVEWTRDGRTVHLYREMADDPDDQDEQFRNRTSLFHHELSRGNISLKLTNVTEKDSGLYICHIPRLESQDKKGNVSLIILRVDSRDDAASRDTGGNNGTEDNKTAAIVGGVVAVFVVVIAVLAGIAVYYSKCAGCRGRNQENSRQGEGTESKELDRLNSSGSRP